jgi:mRNA interferase HigB
VPNSGTPYPVIVHVISRGTLVRFVQQLEGHKDQRAVKAALDAWFHEVERANWSNSADIKASYKTASIISSDRAVFNIKGNDYRLITAIDFKRRIVYVKWIGSHKAYDKIDARKVRYAD